MKNVLTIAGRQFRSYFNGAAAYIVMVLVLGAIGFFFWTPFFIRGQATLVEFFNTMPPLVALLAVPAMTMGLLSEEKGSGTIELLITMPVRDSEVIFGKFLGVLGLYAVLLGLTFAYPIAVATLGRLDWGEIAGGYLGLLLLGSSLLAVGLMCSGWTDNQLVAFFAAWGFNFVLFLMGTDFAQQLSGAAAAHVLAPLAFTTHLEGLARGVIDLRDILYFVSLTGFSLAVAFRSLESRRWS
jgi:ABC-2 type transport system permease protein